MSRPPIWFLIHHRADEGKLGIIPSFLDNDDPRPAREQFDERYGFAGGWQPFLGFTLDLKDFTLAYPGDPVLEAQGMCYLHDDEQVLVYDHAWVAVIQRDGSYEIARMD